MNSQDTQSTSKVEQIHASDLDNFVLEVDKRGGLRSPQAESYLSNFSLNVQTEVDETLDPFSEEYFEQQVKLYEEVSGRDLNQQKGEQYILDVDTHVKGVNPRNEPDISFMSRHVRTITMALYMANLSPNSRILDMGSGSGMSSEILAFCAANVTCVDINPLYIELNKKRASRLNLPIKAQLSEFDTYRGEKLYDLIFFYESLHHALKPWKALENLAKNLKPDGKVVFAAEPINNIYWKSWGLRLDGLSVYCTRKYGWFESGWSESFLTQVFERVGLNLHLYHYVGLDNGAIGLAIKSTNPAKPEEAFNLSPTIVGREYQALCPAHNALIETHHALAEQHHALIKQHQTLAEQHHTFVEQHHVFAEQNQALGAQHHALVEQHQTLTEKNHVLTEQHHTLVENHNSLTEQNQALAAQHHALSEQYNILINSRLFRLKKKVWKLLNLFLPKQ